MLQKQIRWFGRDCILACDGKCEKAFGVCERPIRTTVKYGEKGWNFLPDSEVGIALMPMYAVDKDITAKSAKSLNRWCAKECERSVIVGIGEKIELPKF